VKDALANHPAAGGFFAALLEVVAAGPAQVPFEALAQAVAALPGGAREEAWPLVTLLPFVARPDQHMLLRPRFTCDVALRLGLELQYAPRPSWPTYAALLRTTGALLAKLQPLGARDHVDVEGFLYVVSRHRPRTPAGR
jgi:hypothetical protein